MLRGQSALLAWRASTAFFCVLTLYIYFTQTRQIDALIRRYEKELTDCRLNAEALLSAVDVMKQHKERAERMIESAERNGRQFAERECSSAKEQCSKELDDCLSSLRANFTLPAPPTQKENPDDLTRQVANLTALLEQYQTSLRLCDSRTAALERAHFGATVNRDGYAKQNETNFVRHRGKDAELEFERGEGIVDERKNARPLVGGQELMRNIENRRKQQGDGAHEEEREDDGEPRAVEEDQQQQDVPNAAEDYKEDENYREHHHR